MAVDILVHAIHSSVAMPRRLEIKRCTWSVGVKGEEGATEVMFRRLVVGWLWKNNVCVCMQFLAKVLL